MELFQNLVITGVANGAVYGLVAIGFVLIYKCSSVLNFSQGYMLLFGAFIFWTFSGGLGLSVFSSILLTLPLAFIFGMLTERLTLHPLIGQSLLSMITVTIFLALVIEGLSAMIWGSSPLRHVSVFPRGYALKLGMVNLSSDAMYAFGLAILVMLALVLFFRYSRLGLSMRGVAEDHQVMQSMGINVERMFGISWGISGVVAALAGILLGPTLGFSLGLSHIGLAAIPAAFIGGLESPVGAILGGLLIGLVESIVCGYVGLAAGTPAMYVVLIIVMLFRPYGFFGLERIERV